MKSGQFYRGKIDGIQKHYESPDIGKILSSDKLCVLADYYEVGEYTHFFKTEHVLSKTIVSEADNIDGREGGIINHTVLYQFDHATTHEGEQYLFDVEEFIAEIRAGKRNFKMPDTPTLPDGDSIIIDFPPPLEWEVTA